MTEIEDQKEENVKIHKEMKSWKGFERKWQV